MSRKESEHLLNIIGNMDECYIKEYLDTQQNLQADDFRKKPKKIHFSAAAAAVVLAVLGTFSIGAAVFSKMSTVHENELQAVVKNFDEIEKEYAIQVNDTQISNDVTGTLNSAIVEENYLLLNYTFDYSKLEEAKNSFHTYFLPWYFYITEGDNVICKGENPDGIHTELYFDADTEENPATNQKLTIIYTIPLNDTDGKSLTGKELTVRLLYSEDNKDGFTSTFTPEVCFEDKSWNIRETYKFEDHNIVLNEVRESALYVTLMIDCDTIGHDEDKYTFVLSDEQGNDFSVYPYEDNDKNGYWFTKPENMGSQHQLILKIVRPLEPEHADGQTEDILYEVVHEIPVKLNK